MSPLARWCCGISGLFLLACSPGVRAVEHKPAAELWALKPVVRPEVPSGLTQSTNPIDAFLAEGFLEKKIVPAPPAEKRILLRRVYLDLTGIPPSPEEQDAFLRDTSPEAYDKVVDRLL